MTEGDAVLLLPVLQAMPDRERVAMLRHLYRLEVDVSPYDSTVQMLVELGAKKEEAHAFADRAMAQVRH